MEDTDQAREIVIKAAWPVFMAAGFAAMLVDGDIGFGIILFGIIAGTPLAAALFDSAILLSGWWSSDEQSTDVEDPLEMLRMRYAKGEIDEDEFEHKLSQLLETKGSVRSKELDYSSG